MRRHYDRIGTPPAGFVLESVDVFGAASGHVLARRWLSAEEGASLITSLDAGFLHFSVAAPDRYPGWDLIHAIRDWFIPQDIEAVMVLPRLGEYVNLHPNCFHVWESVCGREGGAR